MKRFQEPLVILLLTRPEIACIAHNLRYNSFFAVASGGSKNMIKRKTVLILGAGASVPYRFPCGAQLKAEILSDLAPKGGGNRTATDELTDEFHRLFTESPQKSIDGWLGKEANERFVDIGKRAIAKALLRYELNQHLFRNIIQSHLSRNKSINCWYRLLFDALDTTYERFHDNKLSVITFNYDRSLEHFLFRGLKADNSDKSDDEIAAKVNTIEIIHVHGQLGYLPWQKTTGVVPYNTGYNQKLINTVSIPHSLNSCNWRV